MGISKQGIIESLESRRLLHGAALEDGLLRVWGDDLKTNEIIVANSTDGLSVNVTINSTNSRGVVKTFTHSYLKSNGISSILVTGGSKNDRITASGTNGVANVPVRVIAKAGDDQITTGSGDDVIYGGAGNDRVHSSGNGNDRIFGGAGNDFVNAGSGDDRVSGGLGDDQLNGENNNDFLRGDAGKDILRGGSNNDLIYGCGGDDEMYGDSGTDVLWGCAGNDILAGGADNDTLGGVLGTNSLRGEGGIDIFVTRNLEGQPNDFILGTDIQPDRDEIPTTEGAPMPVV